MSFINKIALFLCVTAFSGSMVVMGARDMRNALKAPTPPEMERAKKLIQQLRGDELFRIEAKYNETHDKPPRKPGSVLPEYDLAKIKKFLSNLIGGVGTDAAQDPDAASEEGEVEEIYDMTILASARNALFGLLLAVNVTGCILVPFVQAFKETGLTEGDRMQLLPPQLKKFSDARMFGNKSLAMALVASESQTQISKQLQDKSDQERIVKSQVDEIEWIENARKARVVMKVESFTVSQLIVKTKKEEQRWEFSPGSGWLMTERTEIVEG